MDEIIRLGSGASQMETKATMVEGEVCGQTFIGEQFGSILDEAIASARDNRANTNRAIAADIASRKMVQKQNGQLMSAYEAELQRDDLTKEERSFYLNKMDDAAASTARVDAESRSFQSEQLSYSHKWAGRLLAFGAGLALGVGGAALCWNRTA